MNSLNRRKFLAKFLHYTTRRYSRNDASSHHFPPPPLERAPRRRVRLVALQLAPPPVHLRAIKPRFAQRRVHLVVHRAHPSLQSQPRGAIGRIHAHNLREMRRALAARVRSRENHNQLPRVSLLPPRRFIRVLRRERV